MKLLFRKFLVYLITAVLVVPSVLISSYLTAESVMAASPIVLLQEGFDTAPVFATNWTANGIDLTYTTPGNFGITAPSIKFDATGNSLVTPLFSNADKVSFWAKGQGVDAESSLKIEYLASGIWNQVAVLKPIPTTGTNVEYALTTDAIQIRFTYNKSVGNLALDDVKILGTANIYSDISAPTVTAFSLTPSSVNTETGDKTFTLNTTITDDSAGLCMSMDCGTYSSSPTQLRLQSTGGTRQFIDFYKFTRTSGDALSGIYTATAVMPAGSADGTWESTFYVSDKLGNAKYLSKTMLEDSFGIGSATITNTATVADVTAPTAVVSYTTTNQTNSSVIATITPSESIKEIALTHEFTENGIYTFSFTDLAGNVGSAIATVLNIDKTAPAITIGTYNTAPTNQNVIVTASSIDGTLNTVSYTFTENGSFDFVATDAAGNSTTKTVTLDNIDKTAPTAIVGYSTTEPTKGNVTATITTSELIQEQVISYEFTENGTYTFIFTDLVGNVGSVVATVSNIDKTAPTATASYSTTEPTNSSVIATITPSEVIQGNVLTHEFTENGTHTFIFTDLAGNDGSVVATVSNIDKTAPIITIGTYNTAPTNQNVVVTATTSEGVLNYASHEFKESDTFTFVATDAAGNVTSETVTIGNIDKTAPTAEVGYSTTELTKQSVTAIIIPSEVIQEASLTHVFTENGSYTFHFTDLAGNDGTATAIVSNIDKTAPIEIKVPKGYAESMDIKTTTGGTTLNLGDSLVAGEVAGTKTAKMEGSSKISSEISSGSTVVVEMASGTTVTGPDTWDGIVKLPEVTANPVSVKVVTGNYATNIASIEIGMPDVKLTFSRAVRIIIPGAAGKYAGYTRSDVFTAISDVCTANTQDAGDKLAAEGDCKIDSGSDLVIWTKHFTKFVTYNQSLVVLPAVPVTTVETPVVVAQPEVISSPEPTVAKPKPTAPKKAEAAAPETKVETPKDDESGIVKGEDLGTDETNNWTPWIILFILILLAGAATGGYFYWFSDTPEGEEKAKEKAKAKDKVKIQVRDKATEKSAEKVIEPEKNVEKQKEVTKQAAPQAKAPIVSNPVQNVKPVQGASKNNHKKTKRW